MMVRMQIQFTEEQARELKREAADRGVSVAALTREAVERMLTERSGPSTQQRWDMLVDALGSARGDMTDVAENHDKYLAEAAYDWHR